MATNGRVETSEYDVIIVGAGLSGLTSAYTLLQKKPSAKVLVLEASDRYGGDVTSKDLNGATGTCEWDIGGTRIGSSQKDILALVKELGLETTQIYNKGNKFWRLPDGKLKKFSGAIPPLPYTSLIDLVRYFKKVDGMQGQIKMDQIMECKHAADWDGMNVKDFLKKYLWTQVGRETIETMTHAFCAADQSNLSMMQYLYVIHTCGGWDLHTNSGDKGRSDLYIKGGAMLLCRKLDEKLGEGTVVLGETVKGIVEQDGGKMKVTTASGKDFCAERVIVAIPCSVSERITYDPPLRVRRSKTFPCRVDLMASVITYKSPFWREAGHAGEYLNMSATSRDDGGSINDALIISYDATLPDGNAALMAFSNPQKVKGKSSEERKEIILRVLSEIFGPQIMDCIDYAEKEWLYDNSDGEMVNKSSELLASVTTPHGRVHWAGADAGTAWCGLLNGAVQAGRRAAEEVIVATQ
ncbi:amine oxidase [flavin-containing]-like [Asterias amurensis]|uniref:amine oxidase [flavin-containing]-like n=1 Tax=Asterias amurensis TaxID=7602 RepID=UPI003AB8B2C8